MDNLITTDSGKESDIDAAPSGIAAGDNRLSPAGVPIHLIDIGERLRIADDAQVEALAESIREIGLINPITVYRCKVLRTIAVDGYVLIAGLHRLRACQKLGHTEIPAQIVSMTALQRQLAEVDENLCGAKLTAAERSLFTKRRKDIYIALHPETRRGVAGAEAKHGRATDKLSFATDTATRTGKDIRTVRREAERGEKISEEALAIVKGTHLDKGSYLDNLKKVEPAAQAGKVREDLATPISQVLERPPTRTPVQPEPLPKPPHVESLVRALHRTVGVWAKEYPHMNADEACEALNEVYCAIQDDGLPTVARATS